MSKVVWLASYPKSGNTWVRVLLANYLRDGESPVGINTLDEGINVALRCTFDEWVGIEASCLDQKQIQRLRPEVYRRCFRDVIPPFFVKVHDAWVLNDLGMPIFPADLCAGVILIIRNPLDVVPSLSNHLGTSLAQAVEMMCDPHAALGYSAGDIYDQLTQPLRCWSGHTRSWLDDSGLPVKVVRFEDLLEDTLGALEGIARFCGLDWDLGRGRKAVAFSSFQELRRQEASGGFRERYYHSSAPFFHGGRAGSWKESLSLEGTRKMLAVHHETMERFGYLDNNGVHY